MSPGHCSNASRQRASGTRRVIKRRQPRLVGLGQRLGGRAIVAAIGVDRAEHHVVFQNHLAVEIADIELEFVAAGGNAGETDDAVRRGAAHDVEHDRAGAGAFDHHVGLERAEIADVVGGAERANQIRFDAFAHAVEHVHFKPALHADQRRQEADWAGAGDECDARLPGRAARADPHHLLPGLGDHARRFEQDAEQFKRGIDGNQEIRLDAEVLAAVTVALLDAALGVAAVAAHVPFAGGAGRARHRVGPPHDADHQIAGFEAAAGRRFLDAAEQFMTDDQALLPRRRPAIMASDDLAVGAANAERQRAHQHCAIARRRRLDVIEPDGIGTARYDGEGAHRTTLSAPPAAALA